MVPTNPRGRGGRAFALSIAALAASAAHAAPEGINVAFTVGSGVGCTHLTIQAAIDAARTQPGADVVAIASNRTYTAQQLRIDDPAGVALVGGFDACLGIRTTRPTPILGNDGEARSVITHTGTGPLTLERVEIVGGDAIAAGGGVDSFGIGTLRLVDVVLRDNAGVAGGGVVAGAPTGQRKRIELAGRVVLRDNRAATDGGGLFAFDAEIVEDDGTELVVYGNRADSGSGGGLYLLNSTLYGSFACGTLPLFAQNRASTFGGAVMVHGRGGTAALEVQSRRPACATLIAENTADEGGAVYVFADGGIDAASGSISHAAFQLTDGHLVANTARDGAAVKVRAHRIAGRIATASSLIGAQRVSAGQRPPACVGQPCARVAGQRAYVPGSAMLSDGAVFAVEGDLGAATLTLERLEVVDNAGGTILRAGGSNARIYVFDALISESETLAEVARADSDAYLQFGGTTIAGSSVGANVVIAGQFYLRFDDGLVMIPGRWPIRMAASGNFARIEDALFAPAPLGSPPGFAPLDQIRVGNAVPEIVFRRVDGLDWRPHATSLALDYAAEAGDDDPRDLELSPRCIDLAGIDHGGTCDLGAYELPVLLVDSFE